MTLDTRLNYSYKKQLRLSVEKTCNNAFLWPTSIKYDRSTKCFLSPDKGLNFIDVWFSTYRIGEKAAGTTILFAWVSSRAAIPSGGQTPSCRACNLTASRCSKLLYGQM